MAKNLLKTKAKDPTDAVFGVNQEGECVHKSLAEMVHTLIAGTTGSGKSVFLQQPSHFGNVARNTRRTQNLCD